jgi:hypothetical protein
MGDILTGRMGHWKLDESAGLIAADSSGRGHPGDLINLDGDEWTAGQVGNCIQLTAANKDYIDIPHHADFNLNNFTFAFWMYVINFPAVWNVPLCKGPGNDRNYSYQFQNNGTVLSGFEEEGGANHFATSGAGYVTAGSWIHWTTTYNGAVVKIFKDKVNNPAFDHATLTVPATNPNSVILGRYGPADLYYLNGYLDEVRIYNRALSQADINDLYDYAGDPPAVGGPIPIFGKKMIQRGAM